MFDTVYQIVIFISSILSGIAAGLAIILFVLKRKPITKFFNSLLNYSVQISLTEVRNQLELLRNLNADDEDDKKEVINILNDIEGQIIGNPVLKEKCSLELISKCTENHKYITNPNRRRIVSELKENLRSIEFQHYSEI